MSDAVETPVPSVTHGNVRWLVGALKTAGVWKKRNELGIEERKARRIASVARPVVVSYPGSPGYCHIDFVDDGELEHCINAHRAVARDATCTANLYQHALNQRRLKASAPRMQSELALDV